MKKQVIFLAGVFCLLSCNQSTQKSSLQEEKKVVQTSENVTQSPNVQDEKEYTVEFAKGATEAEMKGHINGVGDRRTYIFEVKKGQKLTAELIPETEPANLRFSQIISPSGAADGPFGRDLTYDLNEGGNWKLIVAESNMNGENYIGDYTIRITIK